jgi:integrase
VPFALILQEHLRRHREAFGEHQRVLATASGLPFDPSDLTRCATKSWATAGLQPIELHAARHTFASLMAEAGVPIEDLSEFMGHTTINLTVKTYRHLYPEARRRAAAALDAFLAAADSESRLRQLESSS